MSEIFRPLLPAGVGKTYVEIGGIKWATMNIGANSETDTGLYFQWGDTTGYTESQVGSGDYQKQFNASTCVLHNGTWDFTNYALTKYNADDGLTELEPINDAAVANWGGKWRMPTAEEFYALGEAVNAVYTTNYNGSGVNGLLCTDKTDSSKALFFPTTGYCTSGSVIYTSSNGRYWSSSLSCRSGVVQITEGTEFNYDGSSQNFIPHWNSNSNRFMGYCIRPVLDE